MLKVAIVIRKDLRMPIGKAVAQAVHSVYGLGYPKDASVVVLQASDEDHLKYLVTQFSGHAVVDAGRTVFSEPTLTCASFVCEDDAFSDLRLY